MCVETVKKLFDDVMQEWNSGNNFIARAINDKTIATEQQYIDAWQQLEPFEIAELKLQNIDYHTMYIRCVDLVDFIVEDDPDGTQTKLKAGELLNRLKRDY